jgi:hypothetical protein
VLFVSIFVLVNLNHKPAICNVAPEDNKINVAANGIVYGVNNGIYVAAQRKPFVVASIQLWI